MAAVARRRRAAAAGHPRSLSSRALLGTVGAFRIWWGGTAAPARPIASGLLLLMLPIAAAFRAAPAGSRAARGAAPAAVDRRRHRGHAGVAQDGLLISNGRDGTSACSSSGRRAGNCGRWRRASSATRRRPRWLHSIGGWRSRRRGRRCCRECARARAGARGARRVRHVRRRAGRRRARRSAAAARPPRPRVEPRARARLAALDGFDARARPAAIDLRSAAQGRRRRSLPQLMLGVKAGAAIRPAAGARDSQRPLLAAGRATTGRTPSSASTAGRGRCRSRCRSAATVRRCKRGRCSRGRAGVRTTFWLPVDASFVGLRGPVRARARDRTRSPSRRSAVTTPAARPLVPTVLAAAQYGQATVLLSRRQGVSGADGILDARPAPPPCSAFRQPPGATSPVILRIAAASMPTSVTSARSAGSARSRPGAGRAAGRRAAGGPPAAWSPLTIAAEQRLHPMTSIPPSRDRRFLGVWVEVPTVDWQYVDCRPPPRVRNHALTEQDAAADPMTQFTHWFDEALRASCSTSTR